MRLFGSSGIRGEVDKEITPEFCLAVAKSLGSILPVGSHICVATDTRISRDVIKASISAGLLHAGINVTDFGILPTPALALLTKEMGFDAGIMITASHNPPHFNGIKLFNGNSLGYSREQEERIESIFFNTQFRDADWKLNGKLTICQNAKEKYFEFIKKRIPNRDRSLVVVVDPGNGAASNVASELLIDLGYKVLPINDEPNGLFPNRDPEPGEDTLVDTINYLREQDADLAICFDGDADRVVFCDKQGFLGYNEMITFISRLQLKNSQSKKVITTVETGRLLDLSLVDLGAEVIRGRVGDVNVAHLVYEHGASIGVEQVGVYIMPEMGYYPDSIFAAVRLLDEIKDASEIRKTFEGWPQFFFGKKKLLCLAESKQRIMETVKERDIIHQANEINILDGLRYEFDDSWLLIRPSGTEPAIRIIAEATKKEKLDQLLSSTTEIVSDIIEKLEGSA